MPCRSSPTTLRMCQPALPFRTTLTSITHKKEASRPVRWWRDKATPWSGRLRSCNLSSASKSPGSWTRLQWMWSRGLAVAFLMWPTIASSQVNPNGKKIFWHTGNEIESFPIQRERRTSPSSFFFPNSLAFDLCGRQNPQQPQKRVETLQLFFWKF